MTGAGQAPNEPWLRNVQVRVEAEPEVGPHQPTCRLERSRRRPATTGSHRAGREPARLALADDEPRLARPTDDARPLGQPQRAQARRPVRAEPPRGLRPRAGIRVGHDEQARGRGRGPATNPSGVHVSAARAIAPALAPARTAPPLQAACIADHARRVRVERRDDVRVATGQVDEVGVGQGRRPAPGRLRSTPSTTITASTCAARPEGRGDPLGARPCRAAAARSGPCRAVAGGHDDDPHEARRGPAGPLGGAAEDGGQERPRRRAGTRRRRGARAARSRRSPAGRAGSRPSSAAGRPDRRVAAAAAADGPGPAGHERREVGEEQDRARGSGSPPGGWPRPWPAATGRHVTARSVRPRRRRQLQPACRDEDEQPHDQGEGQEPRRGQHRSAAHAPVVADGQRARTRPRRRRSTRGSRGSGTATGCCRS